MENKLHRLSERQLEVAKLVSQGFSRTEIADKLCIAEHTVKSHICSVYSKIDVPTKQGSSSAIAYLTRMIVTSEFNDRGNCHKCNSIVDKLKIIIQHVIEELNKNDRI